MELILALFAVSIIPIIIVAFLPRDKSFFEKPMVRGFGLGIYLMLVIVLLMESMEETSVSSGLLYFIGGLLLSFLIGLILKEFHHHHNNKEEGLHTHDKASESRVLVSDFFHNIVDGTAIIASFAISGAVGGIAFLGVLGHQILQQVGQHILLVDSGVRVRNAIFISLFVSLSIFIGFLIEGSALIGILLAISAGIVAWKVWVDLTHTDWDSKMVTGFMAGALPLAIILFSIPHAHQEDEDRHQDEIEKVAR